MAKKKNPLVFMDVSIDGDPVERMVFELFPDIAPKTVENFRALCTGEKGIGPRTGKPLHYKGSFFHRVSKGSLAKGGDFVRRDGTSGESIYDGKFPDESPRLQHDGPGLLSMAIADRDTVGSQFVITFKANHDLDRKYVVFGQLVQGNEVLKKMENVGNEEGIPTVTVKIINCGEVSEDNMKNKFRTGNDTFSAANNYESRRKGKNKKSSRDKRKNRRRHYSSDSESSSDSETESSESDSDSDSYLSSSSDISSSSDDGHKKRKRSSKRGKYRHGKRRDRRREKKRKRRDKRSKRKSRRASDSLTDDDSESSSESSSDSDDRGKPQKHKEPSQKSVGNQSPLATEKALPHRKNEEADLECDAPRENGGRKSNGIEEGAKSDRSAERPPDVVDDGPSKSRSRSASPKRTMSKSMSISPWRTHSRSPSLSRSRSVSRSPVASRNPPRFLERSLSRSPARSIRISPSRTRKDRSISRGPVRGHSRRSISRSPVRSLLRSRRSPTRSPLKSTRKSISRSPVRLSKRSTSRSPARSRRSISGSPVRSSRRSISRSSARAPPRRSISRSPLREPIRNYRRSYSRSPTAVRRVRSPTDRGRNMSRSVSPDESAKRIRRGRGFSERYSYARRYRTPSPDRSPVRSYRYGGRIDRERYSSYRRYSPRRYRSPPRRTPPRSEAV
ncbi:peptidyl-prolyl cis-trans isomerase CYP95 isoform X6 [Gossypium hirsutum]|uniref:Peptidyl-prolyl cis-trans isomerase CYP95 isoform X6 n=1 Tax=Gossypium hirsutum TaxID=3635 RepID=A0ABM3C1N8_GOSHI|nr:peptidyl-prolyl cis-trans isomerase CYP95 isoform X6 [Gossypium hirsutum]